MDLNVNLEDEEPKREQWGSKFEFLLSVIGLCIGLGNVWRFPYLCYENGGGVFLIPYLMTLILAGVPVLFLELSLGQLRNVGGLGVWKYCPAFKGVGYAAIIMAFWLSIYYIVILAYALVYMYYSFTTGPLPWSHCNNTWNTPCCVTKNSTKHSLLSGVEEALNCSSKKTSVQEFWELQVLRETSDISVTGSISPQLLIALTVAWTLCYFCIWKGVKWTGKVVYFTATFPYLLLFCLFVRGVTLEGASKGIVYYLKPNVTKLASSQVWLDGATQIFFSYGLGLGTHIALGSYNQYRNNCHRDAILIGFINAGTSFFAGFVVFSVLGFMAKSQKTTVDKVAFSGQGLVFLAYPSALAELPGSQIWSVLFFLMIILIGIDSQFCTLEGIITAVVDEWPHYLRPRRQYLILIVCFVSYLVGICFTTGSGPYIFRLFDHYSASGIALLFLIFCECVAFSWCYGVNQYIKDCEDMLQFRLVKWWRYCWLIFCPAVCLSVLLFALMNYQKVKYKGRHFPLWAHTIGIVIALSSILMIPFYFIYYVICELKQRNRFDVTTLKEILRPRYILTNSRDEYQLNSSIKQN